MQTDTFDLVIAGGGMTGAMLAYVLLSQNPALKLAIVEQQAALPQQQGQATAAPQVSFDSRSIALAAASVELLAAWGLWSQLAPSACAIEQIQVSDRGHFGKVYLSASEFNRQSLGQVIEIEYIGALLYQKLQQFSELGALYWFRPDQIQQLHKTQSCHQLQLLSGQKISTKLLLLCEGGDSPSRQLAGISQQQQPYGQCAVIANIGIQSPHQQRAFERFTPQGPLALLPLSRQRYSLVWTVTPDEAARLIKLKDADFLSELQSAFGYRAGVFQTVGSRVSYPLTLKYSQDASSHRLMLCGNSLHNLHPIAGQGFNLALRDIAAVAALIKDQPDPGCYAVTSAYQQLRSADMEKVMGLTDGLVRLFSNSSRILALGRSLGLTALMQCSELKQAFANQTMGFTPLKAQQLKAQQLKVQQVAAKRSLSQSSSQSSELNKQGPGGQSDANI